MSLPIDPNSDDEIQYLIELNGFLYAFSTNSITKILPAEIIDPQNQYPDTRHTQQKEFSIGCANSWVARSIIQTKQILDSTILNQGIKKQTILNHAWNCTETLLKCEEAYYKIYKKTMELMPKCDDIIEKEKKQNVISSLPQVEHLEDTVGIFLNNAKRFLEKTYEFLAIFYKAPKSNSNFKSYREWLTKNEPLKIKLLELLNDDKDWIQQISDLRNSHDINHAQNNFNVEILNFKLHPDNKCSAPSWRFDFSEKKRQKQNEFSDIITDMNIHISNLLTFFEELVLLCIEDSSNQKYNFKIYRKFPNQINPKCPSIYVIQPNLPQFT